MPSDTEKDVKSISWLLLTSLLVGSAGAGAGGGKLLFGTPNYDKEIMNAEKNANDYTDERVNEVIGHQREVDNQRWKAMFEKVDGVGESIEGVQLEQKQIQRDVREVREKVIRLENKP